jgi:hypothetical protein
VPIVVTVDKNPAAFAALRTFPLVLIALYSTQLSYKDYDAKLGSKLIRSTHVNNCVYIYVICQKMFIKKRIVGAYRKTDAEMKCAHENTRRVSS